jgi:hypothetical protein
MHGATIKIDNTTVYLVINKGRYAWKPISNNRHSQILEVYKRSFKYRNFKNSFELLMTCLSLTLLEVTE